MGLAEIMIVAENLRTCSHVRSELQRLGYPVTRVFTSVEEAENAGFEGGPDLVLVDLDSDNSVSDVQTDERIRSFLNTPVVFLTSNPAKTPFERREAGRYLQYLLKPFTGRELKAAVETALYIAEMGNCRKEAEAKLHEREKFYLELLDRGKHAIVVSRNGMPEFFNRVAYEAVGYTPEEYAATPGVDHIHPDDRNTAIEHYRNLMIGAENPQPFQLRVLHKHGNERWVGVDTARIEWEGKAGFVSFVRDITARRLAEEALLESRSTLRSLLDAIEDSVILLTPGGVVLAANSTTARRLGMGLDDLIGKYIYDYFPADVSEIRKKHLNLAVQTGRPVRFRDQRDGRTYDHSVHPISSIRGHVTHVAILAVDVTETQKAEEEKRLLEVQLLQSQKMEAIGALAGGIAHDFNNILSAMVGYTEVAKDALDPVDPEKVSHALNQALKGGRRARDLIRQILTFSRKTAVNLRPLEVRPIIEETLKLLRASLPVSIAMAKNIQIQGLKIVTDPVHLHQVLMNLCTNAAQAMPNGGRLYVSAEQIELDSAAAGRLSGLEPGRHLKLVVSDTGHGMDEETTKRIFEPFFTTRSEEEGTGMGLAVVHGIVKNHGGFVRVKSEPGQGAKFEVWFPATKDTGNGDMKTNHVRQGRGERILFVDDEESIVTVAERLLSRLGYEVTAFTDPVEALAAFREQPEAFNLAITDLTMPSLSGTEMAGELLHIRPDLPIILATGYNSVAKPEQIRAHGIREITHKPLTKNELARIVRSVLETSSVSGETDQG